MRVLSYNMRTWWRDPLGDAIKRYKAIKQYILDENPDVICAQELVPPFNWCIPREYKRATIGLFEHPIYVKRRFTVKCCKTTNFTYRGVRILIEDLDHKQYNIMNLHSHWNRDRHMEDMMKIWKYIKEDNGYAFGDFNVIPEENIIKDYCRYDDSKYTFVNKKGQGSIIDYCMSTNPAVKTYTGKIIDSDHAPVIVEFP